MRKWWQFGLLLVLCGVPLFGQQVGSISGRVTDANDEGLPGVLVTATSDILPQERSVGTAENGDYRLPLLPPGDYTLTFSLSGMAAVSRQVSVQLQQNTVVEVTMALEAVAESIEVVALSPLQDPTSTELKAAVTYELIDDLPVGQEYRDLVKLIPGVQVTPDAIRGPSAGGSGQDNVYQFDGVNVTLPLFGTLSAEPSAHDIDQIAVVKGGAKAIDFNRAGGFTINSVSRSGTDNFHGSISYQVQTESMTADRDHASTTAFEEDKDWLVASLSGPALRDRLYFYTSYFRPTVGRDNRANRYGDVPNLESVRDEYFGKLSYAPTSSILLSGSYRTSNREESGTSVTGASSAGSTSMGGEATLDIGIAEGSWVINDRSYLSFKYTDFTNETSQRPDNLLSFPIRADGSLDLDIANLESQGLLLVPLPLANQPAYNAFIAPLIERYGFVENGVRQGGGEVGVGRDDTDNDFFRQSFQVAYDFLLGEGITHDIHVGYQYSQDEEDLSRVSNGWGTISVPGGRTSFQGRQIFYEARFEQMSLIDASGAVVPTIHSELESHNIEMNDTIRWGDWSFNLGLLASNDILYGQGLRENSDNVSGFELAPGHQYEMYEVDFEDTLQPRLGAVWAYNGRDTAFASAARYVPAASSLPRAASWARNSAQSIRAYFDANGQLFGVDPLGSSSGKFFDDGLDPRTTDEFVLGTTRQLAPSWSARAHARYRYSYNFWEDTNNDSRLLFEAPPDVPHELYIENLAQVRAEIGGSSYVIAELDGAYTKYWEAGLETEWRGGNAMVRGSYVWSHYYGTFDQDNTTVDNDLSIFIGSSNLADGAGRQVWDFKYGDLRGDRRHQLKILGTYHFDWKGSAGVYTFYQSGQPWEIWDSNVYRHLTTSTSDTNRYAEPAGSRSTDDHYQLDLNYTQDISIGGPFVLQARLDVFNVFDKQTGYDIESRRNSAGFGEPRKFYDPRRLQVALKVLF